MTRAGEQQSTDNHGRKQNHYPMTDADDYNTEQDSSSADAGNDKADNTGRAELTLFIDSRCPLCAAEVEQLQSLDTAGRLRFVDIHHADFAADWPHIDADEADRRLHAQRDDGSMLYGLDVSAEAWSMVGKHRWLRLLRLPVIRLASDLAYRVFARYRYAISYLLTGQARCDVCRMTAGDAGNAREQAGRCDR